MQKCRKINFSKIIIIFVRGQTASVKCSENIYFEIYGQRIEAFLRKTLFTSQKREFLELSNYTKLNTLAILTYFRKQFDGFNMQRGQS